jgi:hypothetical protein
VGSCLAFARTAELVGYAPLRGGTSPCSPTNPHRPPGGRT